jgi:hypothetical protein
MSVTGAVASRKPGGYPFPLVHRRGRGVIWRLSVVGPMRYDFIFVASFKFVVTPLYYSLTCYRIKIFENLQSITKG